MLANLFKKKKKALLGIDITSSSVKVLELSRTNGRYQVEAYASEALPEGAIDQRSIRDDVAVGEAVRRAITRARASAKKAAVAVPVSSAITKTIQVNSNLGEDDMDFQVRLEAEQVIPFAIDEVALDWEIKQPEEDSNSELVEVLMAASRIDVVERRKDVAEYAGVEVAVVDVEQYCIARTYELLRDQLEIDNEENEAETVIIIDVGAEATTIDVLYGGELIYNREQMFGGNALINDLARSVSISTAEAREIMRLGDFPDNYQTEVLNPFRDSVVDQISQIVQVFYSSSQYNDVDAIVLAGGTSSIPQLAELVHEKLGVPTIVANPFANMTLSNKVNLTMLSNDAPSLLIACGLAMRSFD